MKNDVKIKIANEQKCIGTFFELGGASAMQCLAVSGLDFVIIDTEHGPFDVESAKIAILAAKAHGTTPLVRIKNHSRDSLLKMLDVGAMGLVVPCVNGVEDVYPLVEYAKYAPLGKRGFAPATVTDFGHAQYARDISSLMKTANSETLLLPQCETIGCLEDIEKIVSIEGVDGIFIGPYDLSIALGKPAMMDDPVVVNAIDRVLKACKEAGKMSFIFAGSAKKTKECFANGFDAVAYGMDAMTLIAAYKEIIKNVREND